MDGLKLQVEHALAAVASLTQASAAQHSQHERFVSQVTDALAVQASATKGLQLCVDNLATLVAEETRYSEERFMAVHCHRDGFASNVTEALALQAGTTQGLQMCVDRLVTRAERGRASDGGSGGLCLSGGSTG